MDFAYKHICEELLEQPLAYHPRKAEAFVLGLGPRLTGNTVTIVNGDGPVDHAAFSHGRPSAGILGDRLGRAYDRADQAPFDMIGAVAVIPIEGTLVRKGGWVGESSGETSYQGLQVQIARAESRPEVRGVVFEIDSYGGQVNGMFETATMIANLSKAKPTVAILTDYAYSAAYLLASQTRQIIVSEHGGAGSIGIVTMHADFSGKLEKDGIRVTMIHAGRHKVEGNPYEPIPEDLRERLQGQVEGMRDKFAAAVGAGRGKRHTKAAALKTEAKSFDALEALDLGLVDAVGDPQQAFAAFVKAINRSN